MARGFLGLGSNIGERREHLQAAVDQLAAVEGLRVVRSSSVYDTEPVGLVLDQPPFLNACLEIAADLEPLELLDACKEVERAVGRTAGIRHGPRVIDVDVLLVEGISLRHERLNLPHEDLVNRRFVLVPLLELDPSLGFADRLAELDGDGQDVRFAGPPLDV